MVSAKIGFLTQEQSSGRSGLSNPKSSYNHPNMDQTQAKTGCGLEKWARQEVEVPTGEPSSGASEPKIAMERDSMNKNCTSRLFREFSQAHTRLHTTTAEGPTRVSKLLHCSDKASVVQGEVYTSDRNHAAACAVVSSKLTQESKYNKNMNRKQKLETAAVVQYVHMGCKKTPTWGSTRGRVPDNPA